MLLGFGDGMPSKAHACADLRPSLCVGTGVVLGLGIEDVYTFFLGSLAGLCNHEEHSTS